MDADKAARELQVIRELMQRPVRYSTMSGLSGILAGLAAVTGVLVDRLVSVRRAAPTWPWAPPSADSTSSTASSSGSDTAARAAEAWEDMKVSTNYRKE